MVGVDGLRRGRDDLPVLIGILEGRVDELRCQLEAVSVAKEDQADGDGNRGRNLGEEGPLSSDWVTYYQGVRYQDDSRSCRGGFVV